MHGDIVLRSRSTADSEERFPVKTRLLFRSIDHGRYILFVDRFLGDMHAHGSKKLYTSAMFEPSTLHGSTSYVHACIHAAICSTSMPAHPRAQGMLCSHVWTMHFLQWVAIAAHETC